MGAPTAQASRHVYELQKQKNGESRKCDQAGAIASAYYPGMSNSPFETHRHRILRVQLFIEENLDEELSFERLAEVARLSPRHFHRIFKAIVGENVAEYVRRIRLEVGAIRLKATTAPVTSIAFDTGYGSHEAFTRAFRRRFGVSPSDFRENHITPCTSGEKNMSNDSSTRAVEIRTLPDMRVAFLRWVGPYIECGSTFGKLMEWGGKKGLLGPSTTTLGIYHDDPDVTPADKLRADCCITVGDDVSADGEVQIQTLTPGECAVLTHVGPYSELEASYRWFFGEWLMTSGRETSDTPPFEIYINDPSCTPESELVTEICLSLKVK